LVEGDVTVAAAERAERMDVAVADAAPALELDAKLKRRSGRGHEFCFIDSEALVEAADMRERRFAHADDSDRFGFDERDAAPRGQQLGQSRGSHPAGRSAADDNHLEFRLVPHAPSL